MSFPFGSTASSIKLPVSGLVFYTDCASDVSYPNSGTILYDISPNVITGSFTGTVLPTFTDANGGYLKFAGDTLNTSSYIPFGTNVQNLGTTNRSVNAWIYMTSLPATNVRYIMSKGSSLIQENGRYGLGVTTTRRIQFLYNPSSAGSNNFIITGSSTMATASWYMVTATLDRPGGSVTLYLNGATDGTTSISNTTTASLSSAAQLSMGTLSTSNTQVFPGRIATVQMYDRVLTATEVLNIYNLTKNRYT